MMPSVPGSPMSRRTISPSILPSFAGFLMQEEIVNLDYVLNPVRPFTAVVAGSKYDTKIGPLYAIYGKADRLILGGVIYNTFLCAKYGVRIAGVSDKDVEAAKELVAMDEKGGKIVELPYIVESDILDGKVEGKHRTLSLEATSRRATATGMSLTSTGNPSRTRRCLTQSFIQAPSS